MYEAIRERIGQIIGEASMCWSETPKGVFESEKAKALVDEIMSHIEHPLEHPDDAQILSTGVRPGPAHLHYEATESFFSNCPFCGNGVNVYQVPETRYGVNAPYRWKIECMNMGCIFSMEGADQSLRHLADIWNTRIK